MARKYEFTRTVKSKTITVVAIDNDSLAIATREFTVDYSLQGKKLDKYLQNNCAERGLTFIKIADVTYCEGLYGMTLEDFLRYATPLENRNGSKKEEP